MTSFVPSHVAARTPAGGGETPAAGALSLSELKPCRSASRKVESGATSLPETAKTSTPTTPPPPPQRQIRITEVPRAAVEELVATIPHDDSHADINDVVEGMKAAGYAEPIVAAAVAHQRFLERIYGSDGKP